MSLIDPDATLKIRRIHKVPNLTQVTTPALPALAEVTDQPVQQRDRVHERMADERQKQIQLHMAGKPEARKKQKRRSMRCSFRRRVPVLHQTSMVECGAACLAMILTYYGRKTRISEVRERCGIGRDGLSAFGIVKAARSYGLRTRSISLKEGDFRFVPLPAVVHWSFNHFLVVERWSPRYVDIVDPALGRLRLSVKEFNQNFTGVVILLEPGVTFNRQSIPTKLNLRTYAANYIKQAPVAFLQIIGASLLLQLFGLATPLLTKVVVDQIIPFSLKDVFVLLGIGMVILLLAQLITSFLRETVLLYLQTHIDMRMMLRFFEHLLTLPQDFFQQRSSGDILARMGSNIAIRDILSNQLISTILDGSFVIVYFFILLSQSLPISMLVLGIGLLQIVLLLGTGRLVHTLSHRELTAQGKTQGYMAEALMGITTLKTMG
ncbi:MAG TPA: cysteine peptidase family C39 domain-containing protein, partial [Ktedonobacteraceae bacterium]